MKFEISLARYLKLNKYIIVCCIGLFQILHVVEGQVFMPNVDAGVFAGACYYMGDVNPRRQFYSPDLSLGAMVKYNFTENHTLRFNAFWGQLKGNDLDFKNEYQQMRAHSFETTLLDCHVGIEFNFIPYIVNRRATAHAPYIFAGVGYSLILSSTSGMAVNHATIPFGVGYKYRFSNNISVGGEWGFRKTFNDMIDGLITPGAEDSYVATHNNDWYSFAGVYITFRIFEKGTKCPGVIEPRTYK